MDKRCAAHTHRSASGHRASRAAAGVAARAFHGCSSSSASVRPRPRTRSAFSSAAAVFLRTAMLFHVTGGGRWRLGCSAVPADGRTTVTLAAACAGRPSGGSAAASLTHPDGRTSRGGRTRASRGRAAAHAGRNGAQARPHRAPPPTQSRMRSAAAAARARRPAAGSPRARPPWRPLAGRTRAAGAQLRRGTHVRRRSAVHAAVCTHVYMHTARAPPHR